MHSIELICQKQRTTAQKIMNFPKTLCAFHKKMFITHFCQCSSCLLPLCQQCIGIHKQQHTQIQQHIKIVPIDMAINEIQKHAARQNTRIETIYRQTLSNFQKTITLHHNLKKQLFDEQTQVINAIGAAYGSMMQQIQNSTKRKENWFREFTIQTNLARTELINIQNSLNGQKYLRYIIMWNKLKPQDIVTEIINNEKVDWAEPKYQKINVFDFVTKLTDSKNLQMLELSGDMGLNKVIRAFQILRFGDEQPRSPRQPGIFVTAEKRKFQKLTTVRSADKL